MRPQPRATQSPDVPPSHLQAEDGVVGPHEAQGTTQMPAPGRAQRVSTLQGASRQPRPSRQSGPSWLLPRDQREG